MNLIHRPLPPPDLHPQASRLKAQVRGCQLNCDPLDRRQHHGHGAVVDFTIPYHRAQHLTSTHIVTLYTSSTAVISSPVMTTTITQALTAPSTMILAGVQERCSCTNFPALPSHLVFPPTLGYCLCVSTFDTSKQRTGIRIRAISRHTDVERDARTKIQPQRPHRERSHNPRVGGHIGYSEFFEEADERGWLLVPILSLLHGPSLRERKGIL
ncbi:hypothetical protein D9613_011214 [Agrocybe pediades]|uniref:Uncharacterized protein n=1 Tax=Agrocybe pediades TaxID=84607 RepID=A0A8H4QSN6_9AGAR|nr:hypothetical protein D9613_011214 [Agrocybe pediades]